VIAASLPGYAFSDPPDGPIGPREGGAWLCAMMTQTLGFARFAVHGGDWGAAIASWMAHEAPAQVAAIHLTSAILQPDVTNADPPLDDAEHAYLEARRVRGPWESGYQAIQGTKPLTLAYGLADSPVGLAAWIIEKYHGWSVARGTERGPPMDRDDLLTVAMLYWLAEPGPATGCTVSWSTGRRFACPKDIAWKYLPALACSVTISRRLRPCDGSNEATMWSAGRSSRAAAIFLGWMRRPHFSEI
jgi:pimeloyl-ACP methyl ester carboxylesterase